MVNSQAVRYAMRLGYVQGAQLTNVFFVISGFHGVRFRSRRWKVTPKLTFNLGLHDFGSPAFEGRTVWRLAPSPMRAAAVFAKDGSP